MCMLKTALAFHPCDLLASSVLICCLCPFQVSEKHDSHISWYVTCNAISSSLRVRSLYCPVGAWPCAFVCSCSDLLCPSCCCSGGHIPQVRRYVGRVVQPRRSYVCRKCTGAWAASPPWESEELHVFLLIVPPLDQMLADVEKSGDRPGGTTSTFASHN